MDIDMDDLCKSFSSESIRDLTSTEEFENLMYSQNHGITTLRYSEWLRKSVTRYKRYLEYTSIPSSSVQELKVIHLLIMDYLAFNNWNEDIDHQMMTQAAKCMTIDILIINYIDIGDVESIESVDSF